MKAVICPKYGPPEVLQITEVEKPVPKDNEVLIKIRATTVTVADFRIRSFTIPPPFGLPARLILGITKPKNKILGAELSGEIISIGKNVTRFQPGDQIFAATLFSMGAYAEYICLPEVGPITLKPVNITHEEAAAIPIGARTALNYLKKAGIQAGQKILIYGASGSVGTYAVQLAKFFGGEVTGVCSKINFDLVKGLGAEKVLDYNEPDFTNQLEQYDIIFLAIDKLPFSICKKSLKEHGVYLNVTAPVKSFEMLRASLAGKQKILVGQNFPDKAEDLIYLKELVESGSLKVVMDRNYTLDEIVEAHHYVGKGHKKGNVAVTVAS